MSNYNSEFGRIKIPAAEIVSLRKEIVRAYNKREKAFRRNFNGSLEYMRKKAKEGMSPDEIAYAMSANSRTRSMLHKKYNPDTKYIKKCYKKDLDLKKISAQKVTMGDDFALNVTIDTKARTLTWDVYENNRAVESARKSELGKATLRALKRVEWTRNSGGVIKYQDEYQRDAYASPTISNRYNRTREEAREEIY